MFGAMRSSRRRSSTPCPCNNTCRCHIPKPMDGVSLFLLILAFFLIVVVPLSIGYYNDKHPNKRYIHVGDKICEVQYVETGHTSTGASWGYEKAICP